MVLLYHSRRVFRYLEVIESNLYALDENSSVKFLIKRQPS